MVDFARLKRESSGLVILVDGNNVMLRSYFAYPDLRSPSGHQTGAIFGVVNRIREVVEKFEPSRVVVCWDRGRSAWRLEAFAGYKDRPRSDASPDLTGCFAQRPMLVELLRQLGCDQVEVDGVEADDLIAWFALVPESARGDVVILSTDRDFYQLVTDDRHARTSVYSGVAPAKGQAVEYVTLETFADATGKADPGEWAAYRIVNGDVSDKIPGVKGLSGEKRWTKVYETLRRMGYDSDVQDFFIGKGNAGDFELFKDGLFSASVSENWNLLERNAVLMSLPFAVGMLEQQSIDPAKHVDVGTWDERAVERACGRFNFQSALRAWTSWVDAFSRLRERK